MFRRYPALLPAKDETTPAVITRTHETIIEMIFFIVISPFDFSHFLKIVVMQKRAEIRSFHFVFYHRACGRTIRRQVTLCLQKNAY